MLGEGSGDPCPFCCGQGLLLSKAMASKFPSPFVLRPLRAAWGHDGFCFLRLAALCAPCVFASPAWGDVRSWCQGTALGRALGPYCSYPGWCSVYPEGCELKRPRIWHGSSVTPNGHTEGRVWVEAHVKACSWQSGEEWKQKVWLTWCWKLSANPGGWWWWGLCYVAGTEARVSLELACGVAALLRHEGAPTSGGARCCYLSRTFTEPEAGCLK